jgi:chromosome segregation ATPase
LLDSSTEEKAAAEMKAAHEAELQALQEGLTASARALAHLGGGSSRPSSPQKQGPVSSLDHHMRRVQRRISESEVTLGRLEELENRVSEQERVLEARNEELKRVKTGYAEQAVAAGVESVELRRQFVEASEELTRVRKQLAEAQRTSDTWQDKEQKLRGELRVVKEEREKTNEELTAVHRQARAANEEATRVRGQLIELQVRDGAAGLEKKAVRQIFLKMAIVAYLIIPSLQFNNRPVYLAVNFRSSSQIASVRDAVVSKRAQAGAISNRVVCTR